MRERRLKCEGRTEMRPFLHDPGPSLSCLAPRAYNQYTKTKSSSHTTSTKCQYHDTASKPK
jgi:hypothetical protein